MVLLAAVAILEHDLLLPLALVDVRRHVGHQRECFDQIWPVIVVFLCELYMEASMVIDTIFSYVCIQSVSP